MMVVEGVGSARGEWTKPHHVNVLQSHRRQKAGACELAQAAYLIPPHRGSDTRIYKSKSNKQKIGTYDKT
jgi:hypothetical protein